jgi:hypothetical protein
LELLLQPMIKGESWGLVSVSGLLLCVHILTLLFISLFFFFGYSGCWTSLHWRPRKQTRSSCETSWNRSGCNFGTFSNFVGIDVIGTGRTTIFLSRLH